MKKELQDREGVGVNAGWYRPVTCLTSWTGEIPDAAGDENGHGNLFRREGHLSG